MFIVFGFKSKSYQIPKNPLDGGMAGKRVKTDNNDDDDSMNEPLLFVPEPVASDIDLFKDT